MCIIDSWNIIVYHIHHCISYNSYNMCQKRRMKMRLWTMIEINNSHVNDSLFNSIDNLRILCCVIWWRAGISEILQRPSFSQLTTSCSSQLVGWTTVLCLTFVQREIWAFEILLVCGLTGDAREALWFNLRLSYSKNRGGCFLPFDLCILMHREEPSVVDLARAELGPDSRNQLKFSHRFWSAAAEPMSSKS